MKVVLGSDHAGFKLKEAAKDALRSLNIEFEDLGTVSEESVDYPDFAARVAQEVSSGRYDRGLLFCGTGIGMSIVANKFPGIRAALCHDVQTAKLSRQHNDANILIIGGRTTDENLARQIIAAWFNTEFEGGRHLRRIEKIKRIEEKVVKRS